MALNKRKYTSYTVRGVKNNHIIFEDNPMNPIKLDLQSEIYILLAQYTLT